MADRQEFVEMITRSAVRQGKFLAALILSMLPCDLFDLACRSSRGHCPKVNLLPTPFSTFPRQRCRHFRPAMPGRFSTYLRNALIGSLSNLVQSLRVNAPDFRKIPLPIVIMPKLVGEDQNDDETMREAVPQSDA